MHYKIFTQEFTEIGADIAGTDKDVAHEMWGERWQMPSLDDMKEMFQNCTKKYFTLNNVNGLLFTGSNGRSIFLPAAGYKTSESTSGGIRRGGGVTEVHYGAGEYGFYWSSTFDVANSNKSNAYEFIFTPTPTFEWSSTVRSVGLTVRPIYDLKPFVLSKANVEMGYDEMETVSITSGNGSYTVVSSNLDVATASLTGTNITISAVSAGTAVLTVTDNVGGEEAIIQVTVSRDIFGCPDDHHPHFIDLGLPSGTKWSCCNEGASKPEDFGGYYPFGAVSSAPSSDQTKELVSSCTYEWTSMNGVTGGQFTGPSGGKIFLPAAGDVLYGEHYGVGSGGHYWSSTPYNEKYADDLYFNSSEVYSSTGWGNRLSEHSVRPVR